MNHRNLMRVAGAGALILAATLAYLTTRPITAQQPDPSVVDPNLAVRTVVSGLTTPIGAAFLGPGDMLVLEKNTGKVLRVVDGALQGTALDLAVNFGSERGLLSIALHPEFPDNPGVYLYWTESTTGSDTNVLADTMLLGNRVDRFVWDGKTLTQDINVIRIRAIQQDATNRIRAAITTAG